MRITIVNSSPSVYNLAVHRIANFHWQQRDDVTIVNGRGFFLPGAWDADKYYFSCIFTYDLPDMIIGINLLKSRGIELELGGPAVTAMPQYIEEKTGIIPHLGLDDRFEHIKGRFKMTFTSRGCVRKCPWCLVPKIEPVRVEYDDFPIPVGNNPFIGDNCILATSWEHQELVVERMKDVRALDINSGFDCRLFTEDHYHLYSQLHLECFRLAFDSMGVEREFEQAVNILKKYEIDYRRIIVYVMIGFPGTTFEECVYRLEKTRALGCSPYPQRFMPLNSVDARKYVAPGYDRERLEALRVYWSNPFAWRTVTWKEFKVRYKPTIDIPPMFAKL